MHVRYLVSRVESLKRLTPHRYLLFALKFHYNVIYTRYYKIFISRQSLRLRVELSLCVLWQRAVVIRERYPCRGRTLLGISSFGTNGESASSLTWKSYIILNIALRDRRGITCRITGRDLSGGLSPNTRDLTTGYDCCCRRNATRDRSPLHACSLAPNL